MKSWPRWRGWRRKNVKLQRGAHRFLPMERLCGLIKNTAVRHRDCANSHSFSNGVLEGGFSPASAGLNPGRARRLFACYQAVSRVLTYHITIHRPDCIRPCKEQTAFCIMIAHLKLDDRLSVLRAEDRFRTWASLDDERICLICKRKFTGRQLEIRRFGNRKYELRCPTDGCNSRPHLWISSATPLVSHVVESDWWRAANRKHERSEPVSALRTHAQRI
jgi:hypothetical protein